MSIKRLKRELYRIYVLWRENMENDDKYVFCKYDPTQEDKYMWVDCCGGFS